MPLVRFGAASVTLAVAFSGALTAPRKNSMSPLPVTPLTTVNAPSGQFEKAAQQVVRDQSAWKALWTRLHANASPVPELPDVDFKKDMVVVAAMGAKSHGGYGVAITAATDDGGKVIIEVTETSPGARCMNAMMMTSPVVLAKLPRRTGPVTFTVVQKVVDCK